MGIVYLTIHRVGAGCFILKGDWRKPFTDDVGSGLRVKPKEHSFGSMVQGLGLNRFKTLF